MWTPRRLLLLLAAAAVAVGGFYAYAVSSLGRIDGLPQLPAAFAVPADDTAPTTPDAGASPTTQQLIRAFGPASPEVTDAGLYKFKFEDRERGLVFAAGQPGFEPNSRFVTVSPCSVGFFAAPKPKGQMAPGEVQEITTFHADRCRLQYDREVSGPNDLLGRRPAGGKDESAPRLIGMELISDPDLPTADPRRGRTWVTNNQRSGDPNDRLLFRTPGPLFYQVPDADPGKPASPDAPQVWTAAAVEVIDGRNLPRPLPPGVDALPGQPADQLRRRGVVADMVSGASLPPPTMTATGMAIFLRPQGATPAKERDKRNASGYSGVRLIELKEKVQVNLWTDGSAGLPGGTPGGGPGQPAGPKPPALGLAAAGGAAADGLAVARKLLSKSLLVIETTGSFRYDFERNTARFEVAPAADPNSPNVVAVTRVGAAGRLDDLVCTTLVVDFLGNVADTPDKGGEAGGRPEGMAIKALTATGPHVYLAVEGESFSAQGVYLRYDNDPARRRTVTVLKGSPALPVTAKKDRNRLEGARNADPPTEVTLTTQDPPPAPAGQKPGEKSSLIEVKGPGRMELFDAASNENSLSASWLVGLTQQKDTVGTQVQDLLKFEGAGRFDDVKADFHLTADRLWLWVAPADGADNKPGGGSNALPQRLLAVRNVVSTSPELEIGMAGQPPVDQLLVWFRDGPPPAPAARPVAPLVQTPGLAGRDAATPTPTAVASGGRQPAVSPTVAGPPSGTQPATPGETGGLRPPLATEPALATAPPPEPAKKKPIPILLSARAVESWVVRFPDPLARRAPNEPPPLKYEMERARLEDRVVVHQEPAEPEKVPRGLDIAGQTLNLTQSRAGSVMVVTGTPLARAEVHFETTSITGPTVKIDQPNNAVEVTGAGTLRMPSQQDFGGPAADPASTSRPTELDIAWSREMRFEGTNALAEFIGTVKAVQTPDRGSFRPKAVVAQAPKPPRPGDRPAEGPAASDDPTWNRSAVFAHRLDVSFDRPVYFSQLRRQDAPADKPREGAKLRRAVCTPKPDDEVAAGAAPDRTVVYLDETLDRATRKLTRAQRIECRELELDNDDARREQRVYAAGEGEVRILQPGSSESLAGPGPAAPPALTAKKADKEELKLTWVRFSTRMLGVDKGKLFQTATFDNGARVWQTPTDNLNLSFDPTDLPPGTVYVTCDDRLDVTSERRTPGGVADQRMAAQGAAEAYSDDYRGAAPVIRFQSNTVLFEGTDQQPASFQQRRVGVNQTNQQRGRLLVWRTADKVLDVKGAIGGSFTPGR